MLSSAAPGEGGSGGGGGGGESGTWASGLSLGEELYRTFLGGSRPV
jgi:hypothetical protein